MNSLRFLVIACSLLFPTFVPAQVPYKRIVNAASEPGNWLTYSGNYQAHRFSPLTEITPQNVGRLKPAWVYQIGARTRFETSPMVVDGIMYVTEPPTKVTALDRAPAVGCGRGNGLCRWWSERLGSDRQTAALRFSTTPSTSERSIAISSRLTPSREPFAGRRKSPTMLPVHSITAAPLAIDGKIIVGISGGEAGIRGFLDAYDAKTGKLAWRLWTIPGPGEPGHDTWSGDSWKTGGAPTWVTGSFDPEMNLIYWGTGNPGPDWNGDPRPGDNLYSCSLLAIDASTESSNGTFSSRRTTSTTGMRRRFRCCLMPTSGDECASWLRWPTATRSIICSIALPASSYLELLTRSRPGRRDSTRAADHMVFLTPPEPTVEGNLVGPSLHGATNWFSPSYSPATKLFYVAGPRDGRLLLQGRSRVQTGDILCGRRRAGTRWR